MIETGGVTSDQLDLGASSVDPAAPGGSPGETSGVPTRRNRPTGTEEIPEARLRAALDAIVLKSLPPIMLGLGILLFAYAGGYWFVEPPKIAAPLSLYNSVTALALFGLRRSLVRRKTEGRWAHPFGALTAGLILSVCSLHMYLAPNPLLTTSFVLLMAGTALLFLSNLWLCSVLGATFLTWLLLTLRTALDPTWIHFGFVLLSTTIVSVLVHSMRLRTYRRLVGLRIREKRRNEELEEALRAVNASEERFRRFSESTLDGIAVHENGIVLDFNSRLADMFCYDALEISGKSLLELAAPESRGLLSQNILTRNEDTYECVGLRKDGTTFPIELCGKRIDYHGRRVWVMAVRDLTARKAAVEEVRQKKEFSEKLINSSVDGILAFDLACRYTVWNPGMERMTGISKEATLGKHAFDVLPFLKQIGEDQSYYETLKGKEVIARDRLYTIPETGRSGFFEAYYSPLQGESGEIVGGLAVIRDITQRKRIMQEAQEAKEAAEYASRAKSDFLANMSHEIRTPLNGIIGMTNLALQMPLAPEQREYLGMAKASANSLLSLLNDLLDFSKIEAGKLDLEMTNLNLRSCLHTALAPFVLQANEKNIALDCLIWPNVPDEIVGDPLRLSQVVINLVGNALKFTERGEIELQVDIESLSPDSVSLHFAVQDTGIGIPVEKQAEIFAAFSQADGTTTRKYGGTGLGLTICDQLVQKMGGRIWLESVVGVGSTFHFTATFGLSAADVASDRAENTHEPPSYATQVSAGPRTGGRSRRLRILLAEDNMINQKLAQRMLEKKNHSVVTVPNGRAAISSLEDPTIDLVLMDLQMPEMDGIEATVAIRKKERETGAHIPIVAMTAHALKGDRDMCLAAGMDAYVSKPIEDQKLFDAIEEALTISEEIRKSHLAPSVNLFDKTALLDYMDGDQELLRELVSMFVEEAPSRLSQIQSAIARGDAREVERAAHALKGSVGNFHAGPAYDAASKLENIGREGDLSGALEMYRTLEREVDRLLPALTASASA